MLTRSQVQEWSGLVCRWETGSAVKSPAGATFAWPVGEPVSRIRRRGGFDRDPGRYRWSGSIASVGYGCWRRLPIEIRLSVPPAEAALPSSCGGQEQAEDTVCRFAPSQAIRRKPLRAQSWGEGESGEDHLAWLPTLYYEEVYVKGFVQGYSLIDANNTGSSHGSHNIGVSVVFRTGRAAYQSHRALFSTAQRGWDRSDR